MASVVSGRTAPRPTRLWRRRAAEQLVHEGGVFVVVVLGGDVDAVEAFILANRFCFAPML